MRTEKLVSLPSAAAESVYCPFYIRDADSMIVCEGLTFGRDSAQRFKCAADRERWVREVCADPACMRLCPQACILNVLYDEDAPAPEKTLRVFDRREKRRRNVSRDRHRRRAVRRHRQETAPAAKDA